MFVESSTCSVCHVLLLTNHVISYIHPGTDDAAERSRLPKDRKR